MRSTPIESESVGLREDSEGWRLVLKSLDCLCIGLGLVVIGDAGGQYPFWPGPGTVSDVLRHFGS